MRESNQRIENLRQEYSALTGFYGTVINWRFATATVFLGAVAFILGKESLTQEHYLILIAFTIGMWIIELRNRSIFRRILERARKIERIWGYPNLVAGYAFFGQMTRRIAREEAIKWNKTLEQLPEEGYDPTNVFWFAPTQRFGKYLTHSVGLDILFASTLLYGVWKSEMFQFAISYYFVNNSFDVSNDIAIKLFVGSIVMLLGYRLAFFPRISNNSSTIEAMCKPTNTRINVTVFIGFVVFFIGVAAILVSAFFPNWLRGL